MFTVIDLVHALVTASVGAVRVLEVATADEAEVPEGDVVAREVVVLHQEDAGPEEGVIPVVREAAVGRQRRNVVQGVAAEPRNVTSVRQKVLQRKHQAEAPLLKREEAVADLLHQWEISAKIQRLLKGVVAALQKLREILSAPLQKK